MIPLPEPKAWADCFGEVSQYPDEQFKWPLFDLQSMVAYGRACAAAERERAAELAAEIATHYGTGGYSCGQRIAAAIRALKDDE